MEQSEICCVCLRTNLELVSVTETDPNTIKWSYKLNQCVPEVVWNEEDLICQRCIEQVEAASAFRDLCMQSYSIRQQFLESSVHIDQAKTEEITIDEKEMLIKLEDVPEDLPKYVLPHALPRKELSTIDDYVLLKHNLQDKKDQPDCETLNKSFLRDLLQTPKNLLKCNNYSSDETFTSCTNKTTNESRKENISNNLPIGEVIEIDCTSDDDVQLVEMAEGEKQNQFSLKHSQTCENFNQPVENQLLKESLIEKNTDLQSTENEFVKKTTNCTKSTVVKSLLRDLLLKPQEYSKSGNHINKLGKNNFQCIGVIPNFVVESGISSISCPSDSLQTHPTLIKITNDIFQNEPFIGEHIKHVPIVPQIERYVCKYCSMNFKDRGSLVRHHEVSHQLGCPRNRLYCVKSFKVQPDLKQHEKLHQSPKNYRCSICNKTYVSAKVRIVNHTLPEERRYICLHCEPKYPLKVPCNQHVKQNHTNAGNEYICFHCSAEFSSKLLLIAHIQYKHNLEML